MGATAFIRQTLRAIVGTVVKGFYSLVKEHLAIMSPKAATAAARR